MNSKVYKWCAVPLCRNTSITTPNKVFVYVPNKKIVRDKWLKLARRDPTDVVTNSPLYFCEDHFDLPNDMDNYMQYHLMGSVSQVRMKPGCLPKNFDCQADVRKHNDTRNKPHIHKKRKKMATEECEIQSEQSCTVAVHFDIEKPASTSSETVQVKPELVCVKEEPVWEQDSALSEERLREPVCENSATREVCGREFKYEVKLECAESVDGISASTQLSSSEYQSKPQLPNTLNEMPKTKTRKNDDRVEEFRKSEERNETLRQLSEKRNTPVHDFFNSMADVVCRFPPDKIAQIRSQVCDIVIEMELTIFAQRETEVPSSNT